MDRKLIYALGNQFVWSSLELEAGYHLLLAQHDDYSSKAGIGT